MASLRECRKALDELGANLSAADDSVRAHVQDRTVSCRITDLDVTFRGRLTDGALVDVTDTISSEPAQIRLTMSSDDLVDIVAGRLSFPHAWATGRVKLDASFRDLLRLRSFLG
ncbi:MAG: alkyl sulfatase C-terminal domain-containing protein [Actinomycetes bacterium]